MEKTLKNLLEINKVQKIDEFDKLTELFDLNQLDDEGTPSIVTERKTLIIFDNVDFNETYLIDVVNEFIKNNPNSINLDEVDIFYIDDFQIKKDLFAPSVEIDKNAKKIFEKEHLIPCLITLNPVENTFAIFKEQLQIITKEALKNIFTWLQ